MKDGLINIESKFYKEVETIMLPTDNPSNLYLGLSKHGRLVYVEDKKDTPKNDQWGNSQHLYFLSDDEIKEGDWYYNIIRKTIHNTKELADYFVNNTKYNNLKKIIVTTDESLEIVSKGINPVYEKLPRPSNDFLMKYCELGGIKKCLIEYERMYLRGGKNKHLDSYDLKVATDNTITIKPVKDLSYWRSNAEEDYMSTPISVLKYISELEKTQNL